MTDLAARDDPHGSNALKTKGLATVFLRALTEVIKTVHNTAALQVFDALGTVPAGAAKIAGKVTDESLSPTCIAICCFSWTSVSRGKSSPGPDLESSLRVAVSNRRTVVDCL